MGHTYTCFMYHCVFSTKGRRAFLTADVMERLVPFVGGIIRERSGKLIAMNGPADHVHLLTVLGPTLGVSSVLRDVKALSSGWIHDTFDNLTAFAWQAGYGAFTVSKSSADHVVRYIDRQQEHHRHMTFEEELIALLAKHEIDYDPRYLLD